MCVYQIFSIHIFVSEHLGGFIILAIVNNAAVNFWVHEAVQISVFIFSDTYTGVEFLGHMVMVLLVSLKLPSCFPQWLYQRTFPPMCMSLSV